MKLLFIKSLDGDLINLCDRDIVISKKTNPEDCSVWAHSFRKSDCACKLFHGHRTECVVLVDKIINAIHGTRSGAVIDLTKEKEEK